MRPFLLPPLFAFVAALPFASLAHADEVVIDPVQREYDRLQAITTPEPPTPGGWHMGAGPKAAEPVRARLIEWGYDVPHGDDNALAAALVDFQRINGLKETGALDRITAARLSMSRGDRLARLRYSIAAETAQPIDRTAERLVIVNIPSYTLRAYERGQETVSSHVVVGRPKRPTPELSVYMKAIKYNPTWTPPPTIIKEDLIPLFGRDPSAVTRKGLVVLDRAGRQIPPDAIGPISAAGFHAAGYRMYQPAGDSNALGKLKFEITDTPSVYLHDTNHRNDFGKPVRALSSGCVRVQQYRPLASWLMGVPEDQIQSRINRGRTVVEPAPTVPVYLVYRLAEARDGHVVYYPDVYGKLNGPLPKPKPVPVIEPAPTVEPAAPETPAPATPSADPSVPPVAPVTPAAVSAPAPAVATAAETAPAR